MVNKTMGGFLCPHCLELNLCSCKNCLEINKLSGLKFVQWEPDGNSATCSYCNKWFDMNESCEAEMGQYLKNKK